MIRHPKNVSDTAYLGLFSPIESITAERLVDTVCNKIPADTKTLYILFSTSGGSVSAGFVIYNFLRSLPYSIIMHNIASVDSIGIVPFLAGKQRYSTSNATFLIHRIMDEERSESSVKERQSCIAVEEKQIKDVILERTDLTEKQFDKLFAHGKRETATFALQRKLIQEIRPCPFPKEHVYIIGK
jgi:ATP-dependent protease ClpP protease subunit